MNVRRNSASCSQYQSAESSVSLRKRSSLRRSESSVRACSAARRTGRSSEPSAAGDNARFLRRTESCDIARPCKPYTIAAALEAMPQRGAKPPQAERLPEDVGVHRDIHHQRMAHALLQHLVELVDDHVAELG